MNGVIDYGQYNHNHSPGVHCYICSPGGPYYVWPSTTYTTTTPLFSDNPTNYIGKHRYR